MNKPEIQVLKLNSGEEIIGYVMPGINNEMQYNELIGIKGHQGIFERSNPARGVTMAFASLVSLGGFVNHRWITSEVSWAKLIERKEIPYVFIRHECITLKLFGNRMDDFEIKQFERYLGRINIMESLNEYIDDHPFREREDSGNFDAAGQAVS